MREHIHDGVDHYLLLDGHYFIQARLLNNISTGKKNTCTSSAKRKGKMLVLENKTKCTGYGV